MKLSGPSEEQIAADEPSECGWAATPQNKLRLKLVKPRAAPADRGKGATERWSPLVFRVASKRATHYLKAKKGGIGNEQFFLPPLADRESTPAVQHQ